MKFCDILRELIEDSDLTQKQFAADLHIPASTVGGYVQGTSEPDFSTLLQIADYFSVTTDYLLDRRNHNSVSSREDDLLRVFSRLTPEQQRIYIEQGKAFSRVGYKNGKSAQ